MKKLYKHKVFKPFLFICMALLVVLATTIKPKAFTYDDETGNIISDNLFNGDVLNDDGTSVFFNNSTLNIRGVNTNAIYWLYQSDYVAIDKMNLTANDIISFSVSSSSLETYNLRLFVKFANDAETQAIEQWCAFGSNFENYTIPSYASKVQFNILAFDRNLIINSNFDIMLNKGSYVLPYEPFGTFIPKTKVDLIQAMYFDSAKYYQNDTLINPGNYFMSGGSTLNINTDFFEDRNQNQLYKVEFANNIFVNEETSFYLTSMLSGWHCQFNVHFTNGSIYYNNLVFGDYYDDNRKVRYIVIEFPMEYYGNIIDYIEFSSFRNQEALTSITVGNFGTIWNKGYSQGLLDKDNETYWEGFNDGKVESEKTIKSQASTIKTLQERLDNNFGFKNVFFAMADTPFKAVSNMLNFEIFGMNLWQAVSGILTALVVIWIIRRLI